MEERKKNHEKSEEKGGVKAEERGMKVKKGEETVRAGKWVE
jgi:hypothetical protein